ncbi:MAG: polysaccharide biosynthesis/export family protein [Acidobacteriota bacterium]
MWNRRLILYFAVWLLALSGLARPGFAQETTPPPPSFPPVMASPAVRATQVYTAPSGDYVIGPGDIVDIKVFRQPDLTGRFRVGDSGNVELLFIGPQKLAGLTENEAADLLRQALRKYLRQPEVSVTVTEFNSRLVTVIGAVQSPGRQPLRRTMRLLDVIALAGGLVEDSSRFVNVIRYVPKPTEEAEPVSETAPTTPGIDGDMPPEVEILSINIDDIIAGNAQNNLLLQSGDIISVPRADVVYLAGNVRKPGAITARYPITVTQAIAMASGLTEGAKRNDLRLYRTVPGKLEREEIKISLAAIQSGKQKDLVLQANDVLYVPHSDLRSAGMTLMRNLPTLVTSALVPILTTAIIR